MQQHFKIWYSSSVTLNLFNIILICIDNNIFIHDKPIYLAISQKIYNLFQIINKLVKCFINNIITDSASSTFTCMKNNTKPIMQEEKIKDLCAVPSRREFDDRLANIKCINNQINQLLSFVKTKTTKNQHVPARAQQGYQDYCQRIRHLEIIQKNIEIVENQKDIILQKRFNLKNQKENNICTRFDASYQIIKKEIITNIDSDPISKPSVNLTPKFLGEHYIEGRRSRSPLNIQKPDSKYIKKYNKKQENDLIKNNQKEISRNLSPTTIKSPQKQGKDFILNKCQLKLNNQQKQYEKPGIQTKPKINYLLTLTSRINEQKQLEENQKELDNNQSTQQLNIRHQKQQKQKREKEEASKEPCDPKNIQEEKQDKKQNPHIKFVQSQFEYPDQQLPISIHEKQQFSTPYRAGFEIKVYPCNLDKQTIKTYIADRLAQVVKIDAQFNEFQKMFAQNIFYQKLTMRDKKNQLALSLANRGFPIQVQNIQQIIGFDVSNQPAFFSPQIRTKFKNFPIFIEEFVDKYLQAEYQWEKKILNMLTKNQIQQTLFKVSKLDLEKKGYLKLQDMTCFINLHASHSPCFKNKSVKALFARFCRGEPFTDKLSYEGFLQKIATSK